jgi:voltage-gated potassium channel
MIKEVQARSGSLKGLIPMAANPTKGQRANITTYDIAIGILALFSLVILIIPIVVQLPPSTAEFLNTVENALCLVFFADFLRSLFRAPQKWGYFLKGGGWLDLLGSLPLSKFAVFRVARLFRIVRVMRTLKGNDWRRMLTRHLAQSTLLSTLVIALLLIFTISWIVLQAEHANPLANITTYPNAVWWAFVTITTVGYGDYSPVTAIGRAGAIILMFFGLGIIGVLSSYLSTTFITLQRRRQARATGGNEHDEEHDEDEGNVQDESPTNLEAELAAMREELVALRKLFQERYQTE